MLILRHFIHQRSDTVDILGQVVNGEGNIFKHNGHLIQGHQRSISGQKVVYLQ